MTSPSKAASDLEPKAVEPEHGWVLIKRGLYWRPNAMGYTGILAQAGLYSDEESAARLDEGVTRMRFTEAAEVAGATFTDIARDYWREQALSRRSLPPTAEAPKAVEWRCGCGCMEFTRCDQIMPSGVAPGPYVRCVNCGRKTYWPADTQLFPAPAQPQQASEPVAWRYRHVDYVDWSIVQGVWPDAWGDKLWVRQPLYLHPPASYSEGVEAAARVAETGAGWIKAYHTTPGASMPAMIAAAIRSLAAKGGK